MTTIARSSRGPHTFSERKATQLAAYLLKRTGQRMRHVKLVKLIYLIDRLALQRRGYPVSGDRYFNLPKGPVVSEILNLAKEDSDRDEGIWSGSISRINAYEVRLENDPGMDELAPFETAIADEIMEQFGQMDWGRLIEYCHGLPEFVDPVAEEDGQKRLPLPVVDVLRATGAKQERIEEYERRAAADAFMASLG